MSGSTPRNLLNSADRDLCGGLTAVQMAIGEGQLQLEFSEVRLSSARFASSS
jgi:hypothetical protein